VWVNLKTPRDFLFGMNFSWVDQIMVGSSKNYIFYLKEKQNDIDLMFSL